MGADDRAPADELVVPSEVDTGARVHALRVGAPSCRLAGVPRGRVLAARRARASFLELDRVQP